MALSLSTVVYGQKSAAVRQLEQQRKEALADIEETNKLLQETAQTAKTSLNRLNLLSKQILSRKKVISLLNQELDEIEKDILNIQGQLRTLKRELGDKQTNYGKSMRGLYKRHSSQDKLLFILSAESFSQSMRRMRYLREYADWQKRQANDIVEKQAEISRKQAEMEKTRAEKRALLGTRQEESKKLESEEASQKEEVQLLNKRQKDLKADLQKKRRQAEALNRQIEKQIAEEIARAEAEAKAARERAERERRAREQAAAKGKPVPESKKEPIREERVADTKRLDFMTFPRLVAVAEDGWTPAKEKECSLFMKKLPYFLDYLKTLGIYYFDPFNPASTPEPDAPAKEDVLQNG